MPKVTHHIPTESFGFTEVELDESVEMTYEEAKSLYGPSGALQKVLEGSSLTDKDFNKVLDKYLSTNECTSAEYESMTPDQKCVMQCLKRSFKRINQENTVGAPENAMEYLAMKDN